MRGVCCPVGVGRRGWSCYVMGAFLLLGASVAGSQPLFVFDTYRPYMSGETVLSLDRELFSTLGGRGSGLNRSLDTSLKGRAGGRGYVWRPWFSQISGDVDLNLSHSESAASGESVSWDGNVVLGLDLVPKSHVPFSAGLVYSRDDQQSTRFRLDMSQKITSPFGQASVPEIGFDYELERSEQSGSQSGRHRLVGRMAGDYLGHGYGVRASVFDLGTQSARTSSDTRSYELTGDHRYRWRDSLQISNFISFFDAETHSDSVGGARREIASTGSQVNIVGSWLPAGDWSVNGAVSLRSNTNKSLQGGEGAEEDDQEWVISSSVSYRPASLFRSSVSLDHRERKVSELPDTSETGVSWDVFYTPERTVWRGLDYSWEVSSNISGEKTTAQDSLVASVSGGHRVAGGVDDLPGDWLFTASQDFDLVDGMRQDVRLSINHRATLSWRQRRELYRDFWQLAFSDRREVLGDDTESQSIDLILNRQGDFGRLSSWEVDFNYRVFREKGEEGGSSTEHQFSSSGQVSMLYRESNVLGIYNLLFYSELTSNLDYDTDGDSALRNSRWISSLGYQLGRLTAETRLEISESDAGALGAIFFELRRRWDTR